MTILEGDASRRRMLWTMPGINVLIANYELMSRDLDELIDRRISAVRPARAG